MTVLTQALSEKKLQSKAPNEIRQPLVDDSDDQPSATQADLENGSISSQTSHRSRAQRLNSLTTLCVTLTALLVLTTGIVGGIYLYRQFAQYRLRHFRGWCSIPYPDDNPSSEGLRQDSDREFDLSSLFNELSNNMKSESMTNSRFFDEEFDLDLQSEQYEKIEVPDFSNGRKGRFIHDFSRNLTGIVDIKAGRCFILPLNRTQVLPPQSLYDTVMKMRNGYYDIDTAMVRDVYRVVLPKVTDYMSLGYFIGRECGNFATYRLERQQGRDKRSADAKDGLVFREFAGVNINEIQIEGIPEI